MPLSRRNFLKNMAAFSYAVLNLNLEVPRVSQIDCAYVEPMPKELMERYLDLFLLIQERNPKTKYYSGLKGDTSILADLSGVPTRDFIVHLTKPDTNYYAAKLESDFYFGDGFQFSSQKQEAPYKKVWVLTPEFALNRFGRHSQEFSYDKLPYLDALRKLHVAGSTFPDLYTESKEFKAEFTTFLGLLEKYV